MTLIRARVRLGQRIAAQPGIAFVAVTRVKHPSHLVFDTDLPDYEHFQKAQWTPNFRARKRFDWRLAAKASRTLRKYGYCKADLWETHEVELATKILSRLARDTRLRRARLLRGREDDDAWCWDDDNVPVEAEVLRHAVDLEESEGKACSGAQMIAERLLGPLHRPAVLEAMGCLIPRDFHPRYDGKPPRGKVGPEDASIGVCIEAGRWKVDVFEEQMLSSGASCDEGRLSKAVIEFFLMVLKRISVGLELPVALPTHKLGQEVGAAEEVAFLRLKLQSWESWPSMKASIARARHVILPIVLDEPKVPRDVVLVCVTRSERDGEGGYSEALEVEVFDVLGRKSLAEMLAQNVLGVMAAAHDLHAWRGAHVLKQDMLPGCASSFDRGFAVMG